MIVPVLPPHPCMNEALHSRIPRIHLPVAPLCNTDCCYCTRKTRVPLSGETKPGICETIMSPDEAVAEAVNFLEKWGMQSIVGIAGPGDPLANEATFETLERLAALYPSIRMCLCTNGLNLSDSLDRLKKLRIEHISITVNGIDPSVVSSIHSMIKTDSTEVHGIDAAHLLIKKQIEGIEASVASGIFVKVNSVVIPGINDQHLPDLACFLSGKGVVLMNLMPLIPGGRIRHFIPPTQELMKRLYNQCGNWLPVFKKCRQCRADAAGIPGKEPCSWKKTA